MVHAEVFTHGGVWSGVCWCGVYGGIVIMCARAIIMESPPLTSVFREKGVLGVVQPGKDIAREGVRRQPVLCHQVDPLVHALHALNNKENIL